MDDATLKILKETVEKENKMKGKTDTIEDTIKLGESSNFPIIKDNHFILNESQENKEEEEIDDEALNDRE